MEPIYFVGKALDKDAAVKNREHWEQIPITEPLFCQIKQSGHGNLDHLIHTMKVISIILVRKTESYQGEERSYLQAVPVCINVGGEIVFVDRDDYPMIESYKLIPRAERLEC